MLSYGALGWAHELKQQNIIEKLRKLNRLAINTFCVVARSTPTRALEVILDVMPLHLHCRMMATKTFFRIHRNLEFGWSGSYGNITYSTSHMKYWSNIRDELGFVPDSTDECQYQARNKQFSINYESLTSETHASHGELNIYTDGSKMSENRVGAAFSAYKVNKLIEEKSCRLPN